MEPGFLGLATKLTHAESGQWQSSLAVVPLPKNDPQGIAMTYCRRYALSAMLGLVTEEDTDGEMEASKRKAPSKTSEPSLPHLDFTFATLDPVPTVRVLECKTAATLPENLYAAYEMQLYGQIGLLSAYWNEPVFRVGKMTATTFPELCKKRFGIELPASPDAVDIQGWVLCLSMSDAKTYGPYLPDTAMLDMCLEAARRL